MKVKDLMTTDVKRCSLETNLAAAAKIMWEGDCGAVPVTDESDHVVGVITDRDICIAAATRPRTEGEIPAKELISKELYTCAPDDEVRVALGTMKARRFDGCPLLSATAGWWVLCRFTTSPCSRVAKVRTFPPMRCLTRSLPLQRQLRYR